MTSPENAPIAVACDIKLSELFRSHPDLQGKYIDIDTDSVEHIYSELAGDKPLDAPLLLRVVHNSTMHNDNAIGEFIAKKKGRYCKLTTKPDQMYINVNLGGERNIQETYDSDHEAYGLKDIYLKSMTLYDEMNDKIMASLDRLLQDDESQAEHIKRNLFHLYNLQFNKRKIARELGCYVLPEPKAEHTLDGVSPGSTVHSLPDLQETVVHEIQHAIDRIHPDNRDIRKDRQIRSRILGGRFLALACVSIGSYAAGIQMKDELMDVPLIADLVASVGIAGASVYLTGLARDKLIHQGVLNRLYEESIWEARARNAENMSDTLPVVISLKKQASEPSVTPVAVSL